MAPALMLSSLFLGKSAVAYFQAAHRDRFVGALHSAIVKDLPAGVDPIAAPRGEQTPRSFPLGVSPLSDRASTSRAFAASAPHPRSSAPPRRRGPHLA